MIKDVYPIFTSAKKSKQLMVVVFVQSNIEEIEKKNTS